MSNQTIEQSPAPSQPNPVERRRRISRKRAVQAGAVTTAAVAAAVYLTNNGSSDVQIHKAVVLSIKPVAFDCRARLAADVVDTANHTQQPEDSLAKSTIGKHTPLGFVERHIAKTFNTATTFSGEVDSISCIPTAAETITRNKDGVENIAVDLSKLNFITYENVSNSSLTTNSGVFANIGGAEWSLFNNPVERKLQTQQATLDKVAVESAINFTQTSCDSQAWPATKKIFEGSMLAIADQQVAAQDPSLKAQGPAAIAAYAGEKVTFAYTGTPNFKAAYELPHGYPVSEDHNLVCSVPDSAAQPDYIDPATGNQPTNLTTGQ